MRYLVKAPVKPGREKALLKAVADGTLGQCPIAGDEHDWDMRPARVGGDGVAHRVETCFCATPLAEERPDREKYFERLSVKDAHHRKNCRDENGTEPWACCHCDCTKRLEQRLQHQGKPFLQTLQNSKQDSLKNHGGLLIRRDCADWSSAVTVRLRYRNEIEPLRQSACRIGEHHRTGVENAVGQQSPGAGNRRQ